MELIADPISALLIGLLLIVGILLVRDELGPSLAPTLNRYITRYVPEDVTWKTFLPLGGTLVLAIMMQGVVIGIYLIVAGILITVYRLQREREERGRLPPERILQFVLAFRGEYYLQPSVFSTLGKVQRNLKEPLKGLVNVMVRTFYLTAEPQRAFAELRARSDNMYLSHFAYILEMSESASQDAVLEALDNLVERLQTHDDLRREIQANLTSITSQTRLIQIVAVAVLLVVAAVPTLRSVYNSSSGQIIYIVFMTVMLGASYYIDREINKLAERIA
jgi:Flp pilus assembly protein TadB